MSLYSYVYMYNKIYICMYYIYKRRLHTIMYRLKLYRNSLHYWFVFVLCFWASGHPKQTHFSTVR